MSNLQEIPQEIWKDVIGYEGVYEISSCGRVKTKSRPIRYVHAATKKEHHRITEERLLVEHLSVGNYRFVQLYKDKKSKNYFVHRLVASAFIENLENKPCVNHIDGNKHNNTFGNLEWCTGAYNHEHATKTGLKSKGSRIASSVLNESSAAAINKMLKDGISHGQIAQWFNVARSTISLIHEGRTWKHVTNKEVALTGQELTINLPVAVK